MPTGYTFEVCDGKVTDFKDFALICVRAMGVCISMRDEPGNTPIPEAFKPSTYNVDKLKEAQTRLVYLQGLTSVGVALEADRAYRAEMASAQKYNSDVAESNQRVKAMLQKVKTWAPPTAEHVGLKEFMIQQLEISLREGYRADLPKQLTAKDWLDAQYQKAQHDIGYHAAEQAKEDARTESRNRYIASLRASL